MKVYEVVKRHEFGCGSMTTHWEIVEVVEVNCKGWKIYSDEPIFTGTKKECDKYLKAISSERN